MSDVTNNLERTELSSGQTSNQYATIQAQFGQIDARLTQALDVEVTDSNAVTLVVADNAGRAHTLCLIAGSPAVDDNFTVEFPDSADLGGFVIENKTAFTAECFTDSQVGGSLFIKKFTTVQINVTAARGVYLVATAANRVLEPVRVATVADIATIGLGLNNGDTIDGVTLATGDRVLLKDQTNADENGIYVVGVSPTRSDDLNADGELLPGTEVFVKEGDTNAQKKFVCTNTSIPDIGTDDIFWTAVAGGSTVEDFLDLGDVPASYSGEALKFLRVNAGETDIEFTDPPTTIEKVTTISGTSDTPAVADDATYYECVNSSPVTITIPLNATEAFPIGTVLTWEQADIGQVELVAEGGVTLNVMVDYLMKTADQYAIITAIKKATNTWTVTGALEAA